MSSTFLMRIAERVLNRPLLIHPDKLAIITEVLAGRIGIDDSMRGEFASRIPDGAELSDASFMRPLGSRFVGDNVERDDNGRAVLRLPYKRTENGVGVVSIVGSLVNRGAWVGASSGLQSYEGIAFQLQSAARDPKVKSIILDMDSPGGEAVGAMEIAALVRKIASEKPVFASVNGMAASSAYAIASGARSIFTISSGMAGSIGVVLLHTDASRALDRQGVTPTLIHAGAHKVDGNPFQPLSGPVRADLQAEVDKFYAQFLETVAAGRGGRLNTKMAQETEARTYIGADAVAAGLADDVATFDDLLGNISRAGFAGVRTKRMSAMKVFNEEDIVAARAEGRKEGHAAGIAEGRAAGAAEGNAAGLAEGKTLGESAERERIKAIMGHEEGKGREATAQHFALNTDMSVEAAIGALAGVPKAVAGVQALGARAADQAVATSFVPDTGKAQAADGNHGWDDVVAAGNKRARR